MDRSNWKFKKDHDIHVKNIKYKRNHGITSLNQRDKKVMKQAMEIKIMEDEREDEIDYEQSADKNYNNGIMITK